MAGILKMYCFEFLIKLFSNLVRQRIGPLCTPDVIQNAPALPKTRSGKIMRRILRKIAAGENKIGDTTTLADPTVVDVLFKNRPATAS